MQPQKFGDLLLLFLHRVEDLVSHRERSRVHPDEGKVLDKRITHQFKDQSAKPFLRSGFAFNLLAITVKPCNEADIDR